MVLVLVRYHKCHLGDGIVFHPVEPADVDDVRADLDDEGNTVSTSTFTKRSTSGVASVRCKLKKAQLNGGGAQLRVEAREPLRRMAR
jgi:hypothetical protein